MRLPCSMPEYQRAPLTADSYTVLHCPVATVIHQCTSFTSTVNQQLSSVTFGAGNQLQDAVAMLHLAAEGRPGDKTKRESFYVCELET